MTNAIVTGLDRNSRTILRAKNLLIALTKELLA